MQTHHRRYEIRHTIGRGGFGTVYLANLMGAGGFEKPVALKMLHGEVREIDEVAQRMRDEARMLGLLQHRAIVRVDGLVLLDGHWTIVMEYVEGVDLDRVVEAGGMPASVALEVLSEVSSALQAAYEDAGPTGEPLRVQHRDIKPANIQVTAKGDVKVLDFGIARAEFASREAETQNTTFGTPAYMSPERFDTVDSHAGDVYSLGLVAYEIMAGKAFGRAQMHPARHEKQVDGALEVLREKGIPAPVIALLHQMMSYEPEPRPTARQVAQTARELMRKVDGPTLMSWAETHVPRLIGERTNKPDGYSGRTLLETGHNDIVVAKGGEGPITEAHRKAAQSAATPNAPRPDSPHPTAVFVGPPAPTAEDRKTGPRPADPQRPRTEEIKRLSTTAGKVTLVGGTMVASALAAVLVGGLMIGVGWWFWKQQRAGSAPAVAALTAPVEANPRPPEADEAVATAPPTANPTGAEADGARASLNAAAPPVDGAVDADVPPEDASLAEAEAPPLDAEGNPIVAPPATETPIVLKREATVNLDCGAQATLEAAAAKGKLSAADVTCLRDAALNAPRQVDRKRLGLILLVNEDQVCKAGGDCTRYEAFQRAYFEEVDRSDAELMYAFAVHLFRKPKKTDAIDAEVTTWARRALENKTQWRSVQFVQRVQHLHEINARASYDRWARAAGKEASNTEKLRIDARAAILEWLSYEKQLGKDAEKPRTLCASVTGGDPVCGSATPAASDRIAFTFVSIPIGARVFVDGVDVGKAPLTRELPAGDHTVRMESPDGAVKSERKFTAAPKESTRHIWRIADNTWMTGS